MEPEDGSGEDWKKHLDSLGLSSVIVNEHAFKAQLNIGEDAFRALRVRNILAEIWEVGGAGAAGAAVAGGNFVATKFFAAGGILGLLGLGAATTPIGWVVAAGVLSGAAWFLIRKIVLNNAGELVEVIPKFINTPIDVLSLALLDLMMPLALKMASVDGELHQEERKKIMNYFVRAWGYDQKVVCFAMQFVEDDLKNFEVETLAKTLAEFAKKNRDCKYKPMTDGIMSFLRELIEADGKVHENEEIELAEIERIFRQQARMPLL